PQIVLVNLDDKNREASLELCRKLKKDFSTSDIPVVYITNDDSPQEARLYYEIGADSHISKPFDPDLLRARIDQLVNKHLNIREKIKVEKILSSDQELQIESADEKFLREAMDVVEANIPNEDFNLDVFSASMHSSKSLLSSRIRSITGRSPMELVRNARMIRAAQLLATGAYDVTQVCYMVGFSDPRYFATCFKKEYSCTPSSYITSNKSQ
ncbi:MAG: helix-turn-helix domain-containing protein, partial [Bacteroidales bacterium]|nr:helix-turn-helix domain-containing protein [Bacteroidales bacterium]